MMGGELPPLDLEDRALWDALKKEVRPLSNSLPKGALESDKLQAPSSKIPKIGARITARQSKLPAPDLIWHAPGQFAQPQRSPNQPQVTDPCTPQPNDLRAGGSRGLDRAGAARLRRGKIPLEGQLDLHGLTQDQAKACLERFVAASAKAGKRYLLVITGKGLGSGGQGILRRRVPQWLGQGMLAQQVLAFSYAHRRDGERGALYILLRRSRG